MVEGLPGNRRFWPVAVQPFDLASLRRDRDQLWAEASRAEATGESIRLAPELYPLAAAEQSERQVEDPFKEVLEEVLGEVCGKIRAADVWRILDIEQSKATQDQNTRLGEAMRSLRWERGKRRFGGPPINAYARGTDDDRQREIRIEGGALAGWRASVASP